MKEKTQPDKKQLEKKQLEKKRWFCYAAVLLYFISAAELFYMSIASEMFPAGYSLGLGIFLLFLGGGLALMCRGKSSFFLACVLSVFFAAGCLIGAYYIARTVDMIAHITDETAFAESGRAERTAGTEIVPEAVSEKNAGAESEAAEKTTFLVYISGIDTYDSDDGTVGGSRSDVNILAAVNTETKKILLLSTPRDSYLEFSETGGAKDKLTHAGVYGISASMDALERLYGIKADYYLQMNFSGFVRIIDALGGIDVYSRYAFTTNGSQNFQQGYNRLTGEEALAFARERYSFAEGDYQRAENQMEIIRAVFEKICSPAILWHYGTVMEAAGDSFETNIPGGEMAALVKMQLSDGAEWDVELYSVQGEGRYAETFSMPGEEVYVIDLDPASVETAKQKLNMLLLSDPRTGAG